MRRAVACFVSAMMLLGIYGCGGNGSLKVGLGETVITPSENMQMAGFARSQVATGVHDDLHSRAMIIEDRNGDVVAMIAVSISGLSDELAARIRGEITERTGISGGNIVLSCTHTHAGPSLGGDSETVRNYTEFLVGKIVESAVNAWQNRTPARIGIEGVEVFELGRNRRALLYGGVHPDPEAAVIKIQDRRGRLMGVAFNYGCHPTGLDWSNTEYSEDWPYYAIKGIKEAVGERVWVAFYQGAEGNINVGYTAELSAVGAEMPVRSHWYIERKGNQMSEAVLKALPGITTSGNRTVSAAIDHFEYPMREDYPVTLSEAERNASDSRARLASWELKPEYAGTRTLDRLRVEVFTNNQRLNAARRFYDPERPMTRRNEQQAVRIGDAVFVTYSGGLFAEIGVAVKNQSPLTKTFILGECAGRAGYLPTARDFIDGDYEVDGSPYSPKAEQTFVRTSLELISRVME